MSDRKARLKALAAKAGRKKESAPDGDGNSTTEDRKKFTFRNYAPKDSTLSKQQHQPDKEECPSSPKRLRTGDHSKKEPSSLNDSSSLSSSKALENALEQAQRDRVEQAPMTSTSPTKNQTDNFSVIGMAPKKTNWDLKRDINDKLAKLERRTQIAIVQLLKERLESEAVNAINDLN
mmetsp:Transcript_2842/g.7804  ORF Transcript_2842/g.7804 Transcript_2842/m.7804 type:complete len:177 (-) Transcript_2842:1227-1757(-)|eukprot:CAMPEP_0197182586 /NCGR_PEP_ID=MMETSP1423-20130617/6497_1 /TAXON_ID=476441 /ORGANISM="Pseudo-nitzschia heimii, Strain UNC1101" /LENGTH=176 /DNA_ID=CAMNT_0042633033 /DNA_START=31 /DNA_END=561 /DNA_ORIENTATION=+